MIDLIKYYISEIKKYFRIIIFVNVLVSLITVSYLLIVSPWYRSQSTLLINTVSGSNFLSSLSNALPFNLGISGDEEINRYIAYLRSRYIQEKIIKQFNLVEIYDKPYMEDVYFELNSNLNIADNEDKTITIYFDYQGSAQIAANINQAFIDELKNLIVKVDNASAKENREYLEQAYNEINFKTQALEDSLNEFQKSNLIYEPNEQIIATIRSLGELESEKIKQKLELDFIKQVSDRSIQTELLETKLRVLEKSIQDVYKNSEFANNSLNNLADNAKYFYRLFTTIEVNKKVAEFLRLQLEQAKVDEKKVVTGIHVIDNPSVPDKRIKPKRLTTLVSILFLLNISILLIIRANSFIRDNELI